MSKNNCKEKKCVIMLNHSKPYIEYIVNYVNVLFLSSNLNLAFHVCLSMVPYTYPHIHKFTYVHENI
jgi:hypothetical protein